MTTFSSTEAITFGWETVKKNFWFVLGITILTGVIAYLPSFLISSTEQSSDEFNSLFILVIVVVAIIQVIMGMGFMKIVLDLTDGKKPPVSALFSQYPKFIPYLIGSVLYSLLVMVGIILFVIPGIYFAVKYQFFSYLIIDKNLGPVEALKKSGEMTKGKLWNLFLFDVLVGLVTVAGYFIFFVGILVTAPLATIATAYVYRKLLGNAKK